MTVSLPGFDPLQAVRRRAAAEALAAAGQLAAQAEDLRRDRGRLVRALDTVQWRSAAALACRAEGQRLADLLAGAADACAEAAAAVRSTGERLAGERLAGERLAAERLTGERPAGGPGDPW